MLQCSSANRTGRKKPIREFPNPVKTCCPKKGSWSRATRATRATRSGRPFISGSATPEAEGVVTFLLSYNHGKSRRSVGLAHPRCWYCRFAANPSGVLSRNVKPPTSFLRNKAPLISRRQILASFWEASTGL